MTLTVQKLADLAGVSVRTLHHYDEIGLLHPAAIGANGYRFYGQDEVNRLQQILYFKELEFSLEEIREILNSPDYNLEKALNQQKSLLELKKKRLNKIIKTLDEKINNLNNKKDKKMQNDDKQAFQALSMEEIEKHKADARKEYGNYNDKTKNWSKDQFNKVFADSDKGMKELANLMIQGKSVSSPEVQAAIQKHYEFVNLFWDCDLEAYKNLGQMYVEDVRFKKNIDKYGEGLSQFLRDAMVVYARN